LSASATRSDSIHLTAISHRYPSGTAALQSLSLSVAPGEFVSLLGPSGCGKSTLLRLLAGLEHACSGTLTLPASCTVGFVFQAPTLMPWASVAENVALPLKIARRINGLDAAAIDERVQRQLQRVGLGAFANAHPAELSGGMQMRASVARALVTEPTLLLMDEPFAALDEITRQRLGDDLLALWRQQRFTVIFVTHNVYEAVYLSQRVLVMSARAGQIRADIRIDASDTRGASFRRSPDYLRYCTLASDALEDVLVPTP
jgi:NitT/TauT family transport system ATP-binding protein